MKNKKKIIWRKCRNPKEWICDECGKCGGCKTCQPEDMYHKDRSEECLCAYHFGIFQSNKKEQVLLVMKKM